MKNETTLFFSASHNAYFTICAWNSLKTLVSQMSVCSYNIIMWTSIFSIDVTLMWKANVWTAISYRAMNVMNSKRMKPWKCIGRLENFQTQTRKITPVICLQKTRLTILGRYLLIFWHDWFYFESGRMLIFRCRYHVTLISENSCFSMLFEIFVRVSWTCLIIYP